MSEPFAYLSFAYVIALLILNRFELHALRKRVAFLEDVQTHQLEREVGKLEKRKP